MTEVTQTLVWLINIMIFVSETDVCISGININKVFIVQFVL